MRNQEIEKEKSLRKYILNSVFRGFHKSQMITNYMTNLTYDFNFSERTKRKYSSLPNGVIPIDLHISTIRGLLKGTKGNWKCLSSNQKEMTTNQTPRISLT